MVMSRHLDVEDFLNGHGSKSLILLSSCCCSCSFLSIYSSIYLSIYLSIYTPISDYVILIITNHYRHHHSFDHHFFLLLSLLSLPTCDTSDSPRVPFLSLRASCVGPCLRFCYQLRILEVILPDDVRNPLKFGPLAVGQGR